MSTNVQSSTEEPRSIFQLLSAYHQSLENMRSWLAEADLNDLERIAIVDAWQDEMKQWFSENGYCFACSKPLGRCSCREAGD